MPFLRRNHSFGAVQYYSDTTPSLKGTLKTPVSEEVNAQALESPVAA